MLNKNCQNVKDSQPCSDENIPSILSVQNLHIGTVKNIEINKMSKYNFPREDQGPTPAGLIEIPPAESLKYLINLVCHRVTPAVKDIYDKMCMRDTSYIEITKNGIQSTKYDLRMESERYKRSQNKANYVQDLQNLHSKNSGPILTPKAQATHLGATGHTNSIHAKNLALFRNVRPESELCSFLELCKTDNFVPFNYLFSMFVNNKSNFTIFLSDLIALPPSKKLRNKFRKFQYFIQRGTNLKHAKICFYIRLILTYTKNIAVQDCTLNIKIIKVKRIQNDEASSDCPEIFISFGSRSDKLYKTLLDTGAMANLLSWNLVTELGFKMKHLTKTEKFNLKSSSQLVENAIMGMLTLPIYIVLNSGCKTEEHKGHM